MKMKRYTSIFVAICLCVCMLVGVEWLFKPKDYYPKMNLFYDNPGEYDVWFMGSSQVIMGTLPIELYKKYGITSYNLAEYGQGLPMDYWLIRNLLKEATPKLIVLDLAYIGSDELYSESNIGCVRRMVNSLPWSKDKKAMIDDLFEGSRHEEMMFPFSYEHFNWQSLTKRNFVLNDSSELGADQNTFRSSGIQDAVNPGEIPYNMQVEPSQEETTNKKYLRKILDLCKEKGIDALVVKCPIVASQEDMMDYQDGFEIAREYNVPTLDGFSVDGLVNGDTDLWNGTHLNSSGARKWTYYLGEYILNNYPEIANREMEESQKKWWDELYNDYIKWLDQYLPMQTSLYSYLMLASHPQYQVEVYIGDSSKIYDDPIALELLNNIGTFTGLSDAAVDHTSYFGISSSKTDSRITQNVESTSGDIQVIIYNQNDEFVDRSCFLSGVENGEIVYEEQ